MAMLAFHMRRLLSLVLVAMLLPAGCQFTTSAALVHNKPLEGDPLHQPLDTSAAPVQNRRLLRYAISQGPAIAPAYDVAVCTAFLEKVLRPFVDLTAKERQLLHVNLGKQTLAEARQQQSATLRGVQAALTVAGKGTIVPSLSEAQPGDLVQFWYWNKGHCGILKASYPALGLMALYSSAQSTNGFGTQLYWIPAELYIVRLKDMHPSA